LIFSRIFGCDDCTEYCVHSFKSFALNNWCETSYRVMPINYWACWSLMCLRSDTFLSSRSSGTAAMKRTWRRTVRMRRVSWRNKSRGCRRKWSRPRANKRTFSLLYSRCVWQCRSIYPDDKSFLLMHYLYRLHKLQKMSLC